MAKLRQGPQIYDRYTMIANDLFRRTDLSSNAKAIYGFMRSHRDGWNITTERVAEALGVSESTVKRAVKELEQVGYVERDRTRTKNGTYAGIDYTILAEPRVTCDRWNDTTGHIWPMDTTSENDVNAQVRTSGQITTSGEMTHYKKTNIPLRRTRLKEDYVTSPQGGSVEPSQRDRFEAWYRHYPRKVGKEKAFKAWQKATKLISEEKLTQKTILFAQHHETAKTEKQFIPHPTTWLNRGGWDDELDSAPRGERGFLDVLQEMQTSGDVLEGEVL
ncbi:helix-turn-helix domain-containing protein [Corynebacterium diphtheriae]